MERLTLEEAIKHAKEVADMNYNDAEKFDSNDSVENYMKANHMECAERHERLAEWLEELKSYRDIGTPKELKELKENGAFTGLEITKLAIMQKELKEYKDLEEQGLLVRLPDDKKIYQISSRWTECSECGSRFDEYSCGGCEYDCDSKKEYYIHITNLSSISAIFYIEQLGKTLFFTRKEAEKKLEELKNEI